MRLAGPDHILTDIYWAVEPPPPGHAYAALNKNGGALFCGSACGQEGTGRLCPASTVPTLGSLARPILCCSSVGPSVREGCEGDLDHPFGEGGWWARQPRGQVPRARLLLHRAPPRPVPWPHSCSSGPWLCPRVSGRQPLLGRKLRLPPPLPRREDRAVPAPGLRAHVCMRFALVPRALCVSHGRAESEPLSSVRRISTVAVPARAARASPCIEGSSFPLFFERGLCKNLFYAFLLQVLYSMTFAMAFSFYLYCKLCILKSSFKENNLVQ